MCPAVLPGWLLHGVESNSYGVEFARSVTRNSVTFAAIENTWKVAELGKIIFCYFI